MERLRALKLDWKQWIGIVVAALVVVFMLIQLIPVSETNPPVVSEPNWNSPDTRTLAKDACFDCHSNETVWPWYAHIAPSSWLLVRDVQDGRRRLNFSEWGSRRQRAGEIAEVVNGGEMPPWYYTVMHPNSRLSDTQKAALVAGLQASLAMAQPASSGG